MIKQLNINNKEITVVVSSGEKSISWNNDIIDISSDRVLSLMAHFIGTNGPIINLNANTVQFSNGNILRLLSRSLSGITAPIATGQLVLQLSAGANLSLLIASIQESVIQANLVANRNKLLTNVLNTITQNNLAANKLNAKVYWVAFELPA